MSDADPPERSPLSLGVAWAYRISSLGLEFFVPALLGYWIDNQLGSAPVGVLLGTVAGFTLGLTHLLQIAKRGTGTPE